MKWPLRPTETRTVGRHRSGRAAPFVPAPRLPESELVPAVIPLAEPAAITLATRVVLGFRDGSATVLDPDGDTAAALQTAAGRLRTGL
jgi:hypothetical protein